MQIRPGKLPKARKLTRLGQQLSGPGQPRPHWMSHYLTHGRNAAFICRNFGTRRQTFYRWWRRYDPQELSTLEGRSHRPHRRRQSTCSAELADRVLHLRRQFRRWGEYKLAVLLARQGRRASLSMVGRFPAHLKSRGCWSSRCRNA